MSKMIYYDIESLKNIFTLAVYVEPSDRFPNGLVDIFYLSSVPFAVQNQYGQPMTTYELYDLNAITQRIYACNSNFKGDVRYFDLRLHENGVRLASVFGGVDDSVRADFNISEFKPDIWYLADDNQIDGIKEKLTYMSGYNSSNYDVTMLAWLFANMFLSDNINAIYNVEKNGAANYTTLKISPYALRMFNNRLFANKNRMTDAIRDDYKVKAIRKSMLRSGRHLDIAKLNEKQQRVALKRLLGILGYQILESDKLGDTKDTLTTFEEVCELIAYNVSDVVNLAELSHHPVYASNFELKRGLLESYPELVIEDYKSGSDAPILKGAKSRDDRRTVDSSSAQLASTALCPHGHLKDKPGVSYMYPSPDKAIAQGRTPVNVLQMTNDWFCSHFPDPNSEPRQYWSRVYDFYSYLEDKNFNETLVDEPLFALPRQTICMPYFDKYGNPTSCYVTFSAGGIHGAEYNKALYDADVLAYEKYVDDVNTIKAFLSHYTIDRTSSVSKTGKTTFKYGKPVFDEHANTTDDVLLAVIFNRLKTVTIGSVTYEAKSYITGTNKWKKRERPRLFDKYNDPLPGRPRDDTQYNCKQLNKTYCYTSYGNCQHEDFTSYYPNLLIQMNAFFNAELGYDRYNEIFELKESLGKKMKDKSIEQALRNRYKIKRNGTKLVLNSASGAGDAKFDNPIRMNNNIISMRIIGQMFTWRIGQAQTFAGARVISTNTDGLYVLVVPPLTVEESNRILAEESNSIHVEIEPEPIYLISKDSNNRLEYDISIGEIVSAGGGSLSAYKGPNPQQALAHPAVLDAALSKYLLAKCLKDGDGTTALDDPFDADMGLQILNDIRNDASMDIVTKALLFQNIVCSSPRTNSYNFSYVKDTASPTASDICKIIQHYNRVFYVHKSPKTVHLRRIHMRKATGLTANGGQQPHQLPDMLRAYCTATGENESDVDAFCLDNGKELAISQITGITADMNMLIENRSLYTMDKDELAAIIADLDMDAYLHGLSDAYANWENPTPTNGFVRPENEWAVGSDNTEE